MMRPYDDSRSDHPVLRLFREDGEFFLLSNPRTPFIFCRTLGIKPPAGPCEPRLTLGSFHPGIQFLVHKFLRLTVLSFQSVFANFSVKDSLFETFLPPHLAKRQAGAPRGAGWRATLPTEEWR